MEKSVARSQPLWPAASLARSKKQAATHQGLNIIAAGYPKSQMIACDATAPVDGIEETLTAGGSSLTYNTTTDQYTYVWKTKKGWANTCRQLVVKLADGSSHRANFKFAK